MTSLTILRGVTAPVAERDDVETVSFGELREQLRGVRSVRRLWRYASAEMVVPDLAMTTNPLKTGVLLRLLGRRRLLLRDERGAAVRIGPRWFARQGSRALADVVRARGLLRRVEAEIAMLERLPPQPAKIVRGGQPLYLRTELWAGVPAGGSVAHTAGVLNSLVRLGHAPVLLTTGDVPTVDGQIEQHRLPPPPRFWDVAELPHYVGNVDMYASALEATEGRRPAFVYQRSALGSYLGLKLSRHHFVPFVCEFNGSEVWITRHWHGRPLRREALATRVERLNLGAADLVVVVSEAMADQARALGARAERTVVVPNGVDPDRYHPDVDGGEVRRRYALGDAVVVGFIGTFGAWHGAEVLVDAFGELVERRPDLRGRVRLLMVGDGERGPLVREIVRRRGLGDLVVLTGAVDQDLGPAHLAACDVLAAPHVRNPDGSPFFGSPTKLFEYMAMGRGIVASDLDQIGDVLDHGSTAWLVKPGDASDLSAGIEKLVDDADLRRRLGSAARERAVSRHTWLQHTRTILDALEACCG